MITVTDIFAGAGGSSSGIANVPGVRVVVAANHWQLAVDVHADNHQDTEHACVDLHSEDPRNFPRTDVLWASPECFTAGHHVATARGQVPIEEVVVGDLVLTHRGRWRRVTATMQRTAETLIIEGGGTYSIETTAEHPFLVKHRPQRWDNANRIYRRVDDLAPEWTETGKVGPDSYLATPTHVDPLPVPPAPGIVMDSSFWWMLGRWIGDGTLRHKEAPSVTVAPRPRTQYQPAGSPCVVCGEPAKPNGNSPEKLASPYCSKRCKGKAVAKNATRSRGDFIITCGHHEADKLERALSRVSGLRWTRRALRTATTFTASSIELVRWCAEHFGKHAATKRLPAWALGMDEVDRRLLLAGYLSADGSKGELLTTASSISKALLVDMRLLAVGLGHAATMRAPGRRTSGVIEGRIVNMRPLHSIGWTTDPQKLGRSIADDDYRWFPVRGVTSTGKAKPVYNISVEEDESYLVDGIVTHNCTKWSVANSKAKALSVEMGGDPTLFDSIPAELESGEEDEITRSRLLMFDVLRFVEHHRYRAIIVENVVDIATQAKYAAAWQAWQRGLRKLGYAFRVISLNSMHAQLAGDPAPQSRDRVYIVAWPEGEGAPDLDRVVSPSAWCVRCETVVRSRQAWKQGRTVGRYRAQYIYACPACGDQVEPGWLPASTAIDWTLPAERIADRKRPLSDKTMARIREGLRRYGVQPLVMRNNTPRGNAGQMVTPAHEPLRTLTAVGAGQSALIPRGVVIEAAGNTYDAADPKHPKHGDPNAYYRAWPASDPLRTLHATASKALLIPVEGRDGKRATSAGEALRTQTCRNETGLLVPSGGTWHKAAHPVSDPMRTVTTREGHGLLVPYYSASETAKPTTEPIGTLTTVDRYALVTLRGTNAPKPTTSPLDTVAASGNHHGLMSITEDDVMACRFRMLEPHEIALGMAFSPAYRWQGTKRDRVRLAGNAVTPPASRDLMTVVAASLAA